VDEVAEVVEAVVWVVEEVLVVVAPIVYKKVRWE
jgi:hypothetical protein